MISMLPLADGDGWIGFVVFLVIMIISAISQAVGNKNKEAPPKPRPRPRPPVRPAQAGPGRQGPVAQQQGPVAQELEDFLRRAAGGKQQPARQPPRPAPAAKPVVARPVVAQPVVVEAVDDLEVIESVAEHMGHSAGESNIEPRQESTQEDKVGQKFDRQMGQLGSSSTQAAHAAAIAETDAEEEDHAASLPSTAAAGLGALLASPTSLRQAILLSEILNRPEDRWS